MIHNFASGDGIYGHTQIYKGDNHVYSASYNDRTGGTVKIAANEILLHRKPFTKITANYNIFRYKK
jgi:hypothetical protein